MMAKIVHKRVGGDFDLSIKVVVNGYSVYCDKDCCRCWKYGQYMESCEGDIIIRYADPDFFEKLKAL